MQNPMKLGGEFLGQSLCNCATGLYFRALFTWSRQVLGGAVYDAAIKNCFYKDMGTEGRLEQGFGT